MRIAIAATLLLVLPFACFAQPSTPQEKIPADIPVGVRQNIQELYSLWPQSRARAMEWLGALGEAAVDAIPFLIEMLGDENQVKKAPESRTLYLGDLAEDALVKIGEPAIEPLIKALKNDDWHIRAGAAVALGKTRNARAVEPLMDALKDKDRKIEGWAAKGLGLMGEPAVEPLIKVINEDGYGFQLVARALGEIGDPRAIEPLIASLSKDSNHANIIDVSMALGNIGTPAVGSLIGLLESYNPDIRKEAARALGWIKDKTATDSLFAAFMKEKSPEIQEEILQALGRIGDPKAVPPLAAIYYAALTEKDAPYLRIYAVNALGEIGDPKAVEILLLAFADKDKLVRQEAIGAMCKIRDKRVIGPLILALRKEEFKESFSLLADIVYFLRDITGQDFGEDQQKEWQQWWDKNKDVFEVSDKKNELRKDEN
jgi:HEAT repeat protein